MERNRSLDGLKYILIVLVVLGHFIEPSRYDNRMSGLLYSFIYSFHMPLFVWMNGYFYKHRGLNEEFHRSLPLMETCIISHIGFAWLRGGGLSVSNMLFFSYSPSWYLLSLFCWRMASSLLLRAFGIRKLLICSIVIEVLSFIFVNKDGGFLSLMRTLQFYPYFVAGYLMKDKLGHINKRGNLVLQIGGGNCLRFHIADFKQIAAPSGFLAGRID